MEQLSNFVTKSFEYNNNRIKEDETASLDGDRPDEIDITEVGSPGRESPVPLVKRGRLSTTAAPAKNWLLPDSERRPKPPNFTPARIEPRRFFNAFITAGIKQDLDSISDDVRKARETNIGHSDSDAECGVINYSKDRPSGDTEDSCSDDESKNVNVEDDEEWSGSVGKESVERREEPTGEQEGKTDREVEAGNVTHYSLLENIMVVG